MERIVVLGAPGSGKSTFSRLLGERLSFPVIHLDALFWGPNWAMPDPPDFRRRVEAAIDGPKWICEGNYYRRTFDLRLPRADLVIWMDTPRLLCLKRAVWRSVSHARRPDISADCHERLDVKYLNFLRSIWNFDRYTRPSMERELALHAARTPVVRLRGARAAAAFLEKLEPPARERRAPGGLKAGLCFSQESVTLRGRVGAGVEKAEAPLRV